MRLPPEPELTWSDDGVPRAVGFDDTYFSRDGGLAESEAVFLAGCDLPNAWKGRSQFSVGELGFGTGLNALALWRMWRATHEPGAMLHMVSIEAFPLTEHDARRALAAFPEVAELAEKLLSRWPVRAYSPQRLWFPEDGFALTLMIGEAECVLAGMDGSFDAWFLDGFAPARNAAMWSSDVFRHIANLSAPHARAATFSVAGDVRRGLEAVGFSVEKKPGFGAKRERLEALWTAGASPASLGQGESSAGGGAGGPYPLYPTHRGASPKRVAIIGAGIAGAATAAALTRRNIETIVLDASPSLGAGASGNPAGLVAPRLDRDASGVSELFLAAYLHAIATYRALGEDIFTQTGLEERPGAREAEVLAALLNDPPLPPDWLASLSESAALYPQAGVLNPQAAIRAFLRDATLLLEAPVASIEPTDGGWRVIAPDGKAQLKADAVVLACGANLASFEPAHFLPLQYSRGQIEWGGGVQMERALLGPCYAAPHDNGIIFGATFDRVDYGPPAPSPASVGRAERLAGEGAGGPYVDRARNIAALQRLAPNLASRINPNALTSRAALRVSTPDRTPIAGLMPDAPAWLAQNAGIAHGRLPPNLPAPALRGIYVTGALGARGLMLAPLLGELLASDMCGEPTLLSRKARESLHPARFLHRALKKDATMRDRKDGVRD